MSSLLLAALFALTPTCGSDFESDCHRPADDYRTTVVYLSTDSNPDHDVILEGPEF